MVPWYAGAARMDAGLTITERLAEIAKEHKEHKPDGEDRNLIVCIAASSLPYQNNGTYQQLRPDAAIEAADIVLMDDNPAKIAGVVKIGRKTMAIAHQNIVFALAVKAVVLLMGAAGVANMWEAVFADVGVSVIAILNAMRALRTK